MLKKQKWPEKHIFFEKKSFFPGQVECSFDYPPRNLFSRKGENLLAQGPNMKHFFWRKNVKFSSGQLECIFDNPPQNFRPMLCEFHKPAEPFSTTTEKLPPNVGKGMGKYKFCRNNNDPWKLTLDTFTAICSTPLKKFHNRATWALRKKYLRHPRERLDEVAIFFA